MSKKIYPKKQNMIPYGGSASGALILPPNTETMLNDALKIMSNEISKMSAKSNRGASLDNNEHRVLQGYVKSLVEINKELREMSKKDDLSALTNEELVELLKALLPESEAAKLVKAKEVSKPSKKEKED